MNPSGTYLQSTTKNNIAVIIVHQTLVKIDRQRAISSKSLNGYGYHKSINFKH